MPNLLLIDGLNIVRRVYEANPAPDSPEKLEGALRSAHNSFKRALKEHTPTHVLAPFDAGGSTWRHDLYPDYRKDRKPMPALLQEALPAFKAELTAQLGIYTVAPPGVEADDTLVAVARCWRKHYPEHPVTLLSTDKDLAVLAAEGVRVYDHFKGEVRDNAWVEAKFGIQATQLLDYLALMGDSVDGVPGVAGVGAKTAARLLTTYGSLEAVLALPAGTDKAADKVLAQADLARLSRQLVSFKPDIELGLTFKMIRLAEAQA